MERVISSDEVKALAQELHTDEAMAMNILVQIGHVGVADKQDLKAEGILNGKDQTTQS